MVIEIYGYGGSSEQLQVKRYDEFLAYYPKLAYPDIRSTYFFLLPRVLSRHNKRSGIDIFSQFDSYLKRIENDDPDLSKLLMQRAKGNGVKGLKNYAQAKQN